MSTTTIVLYFTVRVLAHNDHSHLMIFVLDRKLNLSSGNKMAHLHFCFTVARALHYGSSSFSFALHSIQPINIMENDKNGKPIKTTNIK